MFLEHDSGKSIYRFPHGAAETESTVRLRLTVQSRGIPDEVFCVINNTKVLMHYCFDLAGSRVFECTVKLPDSPGLVFYYFYAAADGESVYYGNNSYALGGRGSHYENEPSLYYQITVYEKGFDTPSWMKNAIVYQIFPDRFFREGDTPFHGHTHKWGDEPFYKNEQFGGTYLSNDFFGGTLKGIEKKLDYLSELGITAVYLNPIFKAFSNHRYDTGDYETVDETLGTNKDFNELCKKASEKGIKIILDGVFSHTGADSRYFNKYNNYNSVGAYQSQDSPFYKWYSFRSFPDCYDSWWGFETLPNVNELEEDFVDYIAENKNSIIKKWLREGAMGWRLDVADELPDEFIRILRKSMKEENPDALLIGEVWEDASNKVSYGVQREFLWGKELDSVMNYVFREAVLDFLTGGSAELFSMRINSMLENYPKPALYSAMNLISTHDVPRALTVLSDAPDFRSLSRETQHDFLISPEKKELAEKRMQLATILQMTLPGAPTLYYGDEAGLYGYADPFNRTCFPWGNENSVLTECVKKYARLRNENPCLRTGDYLTLYYFNGVICYMRSIENGKDIFGNECEDGTIAVIINSRGNDEYTELDLNRFGVSEVTDAFSGEKYEYNHKICLSIPAYSAKVLRLERNGTECIKIQSTQPR